MVNGVLLLERETRKNTGTSDKVPIHARPVSSTIVTHEQNGIVIAA
jgi:hypothetical protein